MSETTVVGIVQAISGKDIKTKFGEKNVYDIKIDGCWYGGLWNNPKCKKGDEVELLSIETPFVTKFRINLHHSGISLAHFSIPCRQILFKFNIK